MTLLACTQQNSSGNCVKKGWDQGNLFLLEIPTYYNCLDWSFRWCDGITFVAGLFWRLGRKPGGRVGEWVNIDESAGEGEWGGLSMRHWIFIQNGRRELLSTRLSYAYPSPLFVGLALSDGQLLKRRVSRLISPARSWRRRSRSA